MALFRKIQELGSPEIMSQIASCYGDLFPIECRVFLGDFLEERLINVNVIDHSNLDHFEQLARDFVCGFLIEVDRKISNISENSLPLKIRLIELARGVEQNNPNSVYAHLLKCMQFEQQTLYNLQNSVANASDQVTQSLYHLVDVTNENRDRKRDLIRKCQMYRCEVHEISQENSEWETENYGSSESRVKKEILRDLRMESLKMQFQTLTDDCNTFIANINNAVNLAQTLTVRIIDGFLKQWQWLSRSHDNAVVEGATIDTIQGWCELLGLQMWNTREQVRIMQQVNADQPSPLDCAQVLAEFHDALTTTLRKLVSGSFIVEQQPSQIIKTDSKFGATIRLLVGNSLGLSYTSPIVTVQLVNEAQAQLIANDLPCETSFKIINGSCDMEFSNTTQRMEAKFRDMKLDTFKRPPKKTFENVTDEKFALWFHSTLNIGDMSINCSKLTIPLVVIVNRNQESQALATIFWDNAFAHIDRSPFIVPDQVTWRQLAEALNQKMVSFTNRGLTEENLHFLAEKLFKRSLPNPIPENFVTWSMFCKENLPELTFTFWQWFFSTLRLIKDQLRDQWRDGSIVGFISKAEVKNCLIGCSQGTFMLRFAESELGSLSIAWLEIENGPLVLHMQPFRDFGTRALSDRLHDLSELVTLYPNISKHDAFDRYRILQSLPPTARSPYVSTVFRLEVLRNSPGLSRSTE